MSTYYNPVETHFGVGYTERLKEIIRSSGIPFERILLFTRGGDFERSADYRAIVRQLSDKNVLVRHADISNPDVTDLEQTLQATRVFPYDLIVAVGGGSVLDIAKSTAAMRGMDIADTQSLRETIVNGGYLTNRCMCPWIALPTTAGTGSEVTPWATIWDKERDLKYSVESRQLFARLAIVDPALTLSLPVRTSVITGLDALCHATEAYWSNRTNEISRLYATQAIASLAPNLGRLVDEPRNIELRSRIAKGSMLAGLAFSNTRTTACHSISYPLTMLYGIEHGIAASMTLGKILRLNEDALIEKERLLAAFGAACCDEVERMVADICEKAGIPRFLQEYGVPRDGLEAVVDKAFTKGRMDNNPKEIGKAQLLELLTSIYSAK